MRNRPAATLLLLVLCAALAFVIDMEAQQALPPAALASESATPAPPYQTTPTFTVPPFEAFAEVTRRPLFSPTRRPAVTLAQDQPIDFRIVGIIISSEQRHALLAHGRPPKIAHVTQGQTLDGWTVRSILDDRITLTRAQHEIELKPSDKADPPRDKADQSPDKAQPSPPVQSPRQSLPSPPADAIGQPTCGGLPIEACS